MGLELPPKLTQNLFLWNNLLNLLQGVVVYYITSICAAVDFL